MNKLSVLSIGFGLLLAACGGAAAPASPAPPAASAPAQKPVASANAPASTAAAPAAQKPAASANAASEAAKPAGSAAPAASGAAGPVPEKTKITVGRSAPGGTFLPVITAAEAGYFKNHGLDVQLEMMPPPTANAGLASGSLDVYEGATSVITAILGGADLVYVAAPVDRNNQVLVGRPGMTDFTSIRGKSVATTSAGAFGDIAARWSAKKYGMQVGKDFKLIYLPTGDADVSTFKSGNADAVLIPPPFSIEAEDNGANPVLVDYYKEDFRVVGPGTAVTKTFFQKYPNTLNEFLRGYLDGLKRDLDDPAYAKQLDAKYAKLDPSLLDADYEQAKKQWNINLVVNPASIQVALDGSDDPKAKAAKPDTMYDNSVINAVNKDYGSKLFPNDIK